MNSLFMQLVAVNVVLACFNSAMAVVNWRRGNRVLATACVVVLLGCVSVVMVALRH